MTALAIWKQAAGLVVPEPDDVAETCAALREAAAQEDEATLTSDALAIDRVQLLETGLEFHHKHGDQPCPVCLDGTLDGGWASRAREALTRERDAAQVLRAARSATYRARQALDKLVDAVSPPPVEDAELTTVAAARLAHQALSQHVDGHVAYTEHVAATMPEVCASYATLSAEAHALISARDDA